MCMKKGLLKSAVLSFVGASLVVPTEYIPHTASLQGVEHIGKNSSFAKMSFFLNRLHANRELFLTI